MRVALIRLLIGRITVLHIVSWHTQWGALVLALSLTPVRAFADQEAGNTAYVQASDYGHYYAKSVPSGRYGNDGTTKVYQVTDAEDVLLNTHEWFAPRMFLEGFRGLNTVYVIQMGPWARGRAPQANHLAFAIYKGNELIKRYSTLAISKLGASPSVSVSHYTMFRDIPGFRRPYGNQLVFEVITHDEKRLTFDVDTGAILSPKDEETRKRLYRARSAISRIKFQWYQAHEKEVPHIKEHKITEAELRRTDAAAYPELPEGYRYVADSIWKPVKFERRE